MSNINKTFIIAEAGVNHNGNIETAKKLIDAASYAKADAVKFQSFNAEKMVSSFAPKAQYQTKNTLQSESQLEMLKRLQLSYEDHVELITYCKSKSIQFLSTPFDIQSLKMLEELNIPFYKISSGDITNLPLLRAVAHTHKKVVFSSGMSTIDEIVQAANILKEGGASEICVLHCNTEYPTPYEDANLLAINTIKNETGLNVGYSDHTLGIYAPIAAVALGACVIEKHFTLDRNMQGPDHKASLEPSELGEMVRAIRAVELCMGSNIKQITLSEGKNKSVARKSIVASRDIKSGEIFTDDNITTKRPGDGLSPMLWDKIIGQKSKYDFVKDEYIKL